MNVLQKFDETNEIPLRLPVSVSRARAMDDISLFRSIKTTQKKSALESGCQSFDNLKQKKKFRPMRRPNDDNTCGEKKSPPSRIRIPRAIAISLGTI